MLCWSIYIIVFYNLKDNPTFVSEERLVNSVRARERFVGLSILLCSIFYKITPFFHSEERLIQLNKRKIVLCWAISIIYLRLSSSCCRSASRFIFSSSSLSLDWVFTLSDLPTAPTLNQYIVVKSKSGL